MAANDTTATAGGFELDMDDLLDEGYDPLADDSEVDEDVDFPVGDASNLKAAERPEVQEVPAHDPRPASERIAELFGRMAPRRKTLLAILRQCRDKQPVREVASFIDDLKTRDHSVYSANDFCSLLERAGAIERVGEDGQSYEEVELEPKTVVVDGVEYLEPQTPPPAFWVTTQAALDFLAAENPLTKTERLFEDEPDYLPIYRRILTLCSAAEGSGAKAIAKACDSDPLLLKPRYYSSRFVEKLNQSDALTWAGKTWQLTETGRQALVQLEAVQDPASDEILAGLEA